MAKLLFQWVYWHVLLPGRDDPRHRLAAATAARSTTMTTPRRHAVDVDAEGFLTTPSSGPSEMAARDRARRRHRRSSPTATGRSSPSCATPTCATGTAPTIRTLGKASGVPIKELYQLFPKGPAKLAAKIAGIPKPRGCI